MKGILAKHASFVAAAVISLVWTWAKGVAWVTEGGSLSALPITTLADL